jgi:hypothetical protein
VQARHDDIGQEQVNRVLVLLRDPECFLGVTRLQEAVSLGRQHVPGDGADIRLIVNQQGRFHRPGILPI